MTDQTQITPTATVPDNAPVAAILTPPTAANVDIEQLTTQASMKAAEAAEKKMEAVFKSMLQQNGMDAESINKMTAEWKSKQQTPENLLQELTGTNTALKGENEKLQRQLLAVGKGIPADKSDKYIALAQSYLAEGVDFGKALDAALADFPVQGQLQTQQPQPHGFNLLQPDQPNPNKKTTYETQYAEAKKAGNSQAMIRIKGMAFKDGIVL